MRSRIIELIEADAATDNSIVFLTGDLGFSVVEPLEDALGERFINMGVAEANMISVAASLAATGFRPFAYSIVPFITGRCFEQIRNDIAYQKRAVRLIGVGAGFSYGALGPSHHGLEDAAIMASLPEMAVANPGNVAELDRCYAALRHDERPVYFRIARESGLSYPVPIFSAERAAYEARTGEDIVLAASGVTVSECLKAADRLEQIGIFASVVSVPIPHPFPKDEFATLIRDTPVISVFEGYRGNPLSLGVMEVLLERGRGNRYLDLVAPQRFLHVVGGAESLRREAGLDAAAIASAAQKLLGGNLARRVARGAP